MLNLKIKTDESFVAVGQSNAIVLNATLTDDPTIQEDYLSIPIDGTFMVIDQVSSLPKPDTSYMPVHNPDGK